MPKLQKTNFLSYLGTLTIFFILLLSVGCNKKSGTLPSPIFPVKVVRPIMQNVPIHMDYVGHIEPYSYVEVKSQIEGVLMKRHFEEGQEVKHGDLLFTIDPRPYQAALQKAEANVALNRANLKLAQDTAKRYARLVSQDYVSQLDYEKYITNVSVTDAQLEQSFADLETAKLNLEYCYIRAPMDAVAGNVLVYEGNLIPNAGTEALVTLNQIQPIFVSFYVPENDLPIIQEHREQHPLQTVIFLGRNATLCFQGILSSINNQVDESTGTILLQSTFNNMDKKLWPGEFVDVKLILREEKDAILLPSQAVQVGQNGPYIYVVKEDQTVEMRSVTTGQREGDYIIIKKGVKMGDTVVVEGQLNLSTGAKVSIKGL